MLTVLKLPFAFDTARLKADLAQIEPSDWVPHFNTQEFEGDWSVVPLRSIDGKARFIYPDPTASLGRFLDTRVLERCPYFRAVMDTFEMPKRSVRLLRLGTGSRILEHRDYCLGFEDGEVRIHIPVVTSPLVEFYSSGERVEMREGEAWYVNFNLPHRLYNGAGIDRVHLVIDGPVNDWVRTMFYTLNFEQFRMRVLEESAMDAGAPHADTFAADLVTKGSELGYTFGAEQVQRALGLAPQADAAGCEGV
ncbi:MAG TPA: aspartyl/asparaginyl beta-hydroxylase domain-containing protein [Bryobacteraceae bacterium]|nr:aspartyl/asparaginyl beta-hydroxylase domain-containing protein [Bryobacteraceae bacterium]